MPELNDYLNTSFDCECGRTHHVELEEVRYGDDVLTCLPTLLARAKAGVITVVADARTLAAAGERVCARAAESGSRVHRVLLPDGPHGSPVCDEETRAVLLDALDRETQLLLAVGSGVVNDLCKWVSTGTGIPYWVVGTAASMNGYASANIAPAIDGVKRVVEGVVPRIILAEPATLRAAPFELTAAGLGDVLAKPVSTTDWRINQLLFDEYYCPVCAGMIDDLEPLYFDRPAALAARGAQAMESLFMALVFSGLAMTMAGTSFPASGGEHMPSHVLDMKALAEDVSHDLHGRQVGIGVLFTAALYERILACEAPEFRVRTEPTDRAYWGKLTDIVEEEHAAKRNRATQAVERLKAPGTWDRVRALASERIKSPAAIKHCLREAGAAHTLAEIDCSRERFQDAVAHCHQIRERYTVIDLARACGLLPDATEEIVEEYLG